MFHIYETSLYISHTNTCFIYIYIYDNFLYCINKITPLDALYFIFLRAHILVCIHRVYTIN